MKSARGKLVSRMRSRRVASVLVAATMSLTLLSAGLASAGPSDEEKHKEEKPSKCETGYEDREHLGRSCKTDRGTYELKSDDGWIGETHGLDENFALAPAEPKGKKPGGGTGGGGGTTPLPGLTKGGICVTPPEARTEVIYAVPIDLPDRYLEVKNKVSELFVRSDMKLHEESMEFGYSSHFKVLCDATGNVSVARAQLATPSYQDTVDSIINDLRKLGFTDENVKYLVYYDSAFGGYGGVGMDGCGGWQLLGDDPGLPGGCHHAGPSYGITFGNLSAWYISMHEHGHANGAVSPSAPHGTYGHHCTDEEDIMCYQDAADVQMTYPCSVEHFDCGHDDYFHPAPGPTNYLYNNWNVGDCMNRWIINTYCGGGQQPVAEAGQNSYCTAGVQCDVVGASATDADADLAYYHWTWQGCTTASNACPEISYRDDARRISGPSSVVRLTFWPRERGTHELRLLVADHRGNSHVDTVTITVL